MATEYNIEIQRFDKTRAVITIEGVTSAQLIEASGEDFVNAGLSSYDGMPNGGVIVGPQLDKDGDPSIEEVLAIVTNVMAVNFPDLEQNVVSIFEQAS